MYFYCYNIIFIFLLLPNEYFPNTNQNKSLNKVCNNTAYAYADNSEIENVYNNIHDILK